MKRAVSVFLAIIFICAVFLPSIPALAANDVCFIALNERLLELSSSAYISSGSTYVPYTVFLSFKIYSSYFSSDTTALLYTSDKQLYFNISEGTCTDGAGNSYSSSALWINGLVYVPVSFVCSQFGLNWSFIEGTGYGNICRIKDSAVVLSDADFLAAATTSMMNKYNAYKGGYTPGEQYTQDDEGVSVYLTFQGVPSSSLLDALKSLKVTAAFFVTAYGVKAYPDIIRRIVGEGHSVGVLCSDSPYTEYLAASELIFEAARTTTVLIASSSREYDAVCRASAERNDLVFWDYDIDGVQNGAGISYASTVTSYLAFAEERADVRLLCCDATDSCISGVLGYIASGGFAVRRVTEISVDNR